MKKKQHYVPRMILKYFTIDGDNDRCWEYNLNNKRFAKKRIEEICASNYLYEIRDNQGKFLDNSRINVVEDGFCKIEEQFNEFFDDLLNNLRGLDNINLAPEEIETIYVWIALMLLRNPMILNVLPDVGKELGVPIKGKLVTTYTYISIMPMQLEGYINDLKQGHITFLRAEKQSSFVISDIPLVLTGTPLHDFCYMPISSEYAVLVKKKETLLTNTNKCLIKTLSSDETDYYNMMMHDVLFNMFESKYKFGGSLIAKDKNILKKLVLPGYYEMFE